MSSIIRVENLTKVFETYQKEEGLKGSIKNLFFRKMIQNTAVDSINFEIGAGEIVGFLGPNGAGKTTTLKMLSGLIHPTSGQAEVMGFVPWQRSNEFRRQYSIVMGQKNQLWMDLPAIESFNLNKEIYQIPEQQYKDILEELTDLLDVRSIMHTQVRRLSLGERMKMELIAALLHSPKVIFLDEPTIGLDIISQRKIREFLKRYNEKFGTSIMLTSHYMDDIEALCKRVIIINHGQKIYDGELSQIVNDFSGYKEIAVTFAEPVTEHQMASVAPYQDFNPFKVNFRVRREELTHVISGLLNQHRVEDISTSEVGIDEVIEQIFSSGRGDKR